MVVKVGGAVGNGEWFEYLIPNQKKIPLWNVLSLLNEEKGIEQIERWTGG